MKKTKRFLSMLLALTMTFSVVFIGTGGSVLPVSFAADPPIVPRVADKQAPEGLVFTVPEYIETYGDNYYMRGNNVKAITDAVKFGAIENTSYSISNVELTVTDSTGASTVQMSNYYNSADASAKLYVWSLSGGTVSANATYVKYVVTYTYKYPYNGDTSNMVTASYTSTAVSAIKQASNPATNYTTASNDNPWATHITRNYHYLYAENSIGLGAETATVNGYIDFSSGTYGTWVESTAEGVSGYRYDRSSDSASSCDWTFSESGYQTGVYYVDVDANPNLSTAGIRLVLANHAETDSDHPFTVNGFQINTATINSTNVTSNYAFINDSISGVSKATSKATYYATLSGSAPSAGNTLFLTIYLKTEGNVTGAVSSRLTVEENMYLRVIAYSKANLKAQLNTEIAANRQARYYTDASWATYYNAFIEAYRVKGNPTAVQTEIDAAYTNLVNAAAGLVAVNADYSSTQVALNYIPQDFYTNPEYYTDATRAALEDAIADVNYGLSGAANVLALNNSDGTYSYTINEAAKMKSNYQMAVTKMANNVFNAAKALTYKSFNLSFVTNGGTEIPAVSYQLFSPLSAPTVETTREHYEFEGWYTDATFTNKITDWSSLTMPYNGMTVYANWILTSVTVTFVENGGSNIDDYVGVAGDKWTGPETEPTRTSFEFAGWYYDDISFSEPVDWDTFVIPEGGVTLYAKWDFASYTITFETNGGTAVEPITAMYTSLVQRPADPTKPGCGFIGWYLNSSLTGNPVSWPLSMPSYDITLYAAWNENGYTVVFESNGGSAVSSITSSVGLGVTRPADPSKAGFVFAGWYYDEALTDAVDWNSFRETSGEIRLYAKWTALKYTVSFNTNGGTPINSVTLDCGTIYDIPETTLKDYVFAGWYYDEALTIPVEGDFAVPAYNVVLYAKWEPEPDTARVTLKTDVANTTTNGTIVTGTVSQGDIINVTVNLETNYIVGSHSAIVYYDSNYFEPAMDGEAYTTVHNGVAAAITSGFITMVDNTDEDGVDYNVWGNGTVTGKVNIITPIVAFYPASWRANATTLNTAYSSYKYVQVGVAQNAGSVNGGYAVEADPAQDLFTFQLKVREDAPITDGTNYANILIPTEAVRTDTNTYTKNMKVYATKTSANAYSSTNTQTLYGMDYYLIDNDVRLQVTAMETATINFDANGGVTVDPITAKVGSTITLPTTTKQNYTFKGWTLDGVAVDADAYLVTAGTVTLKAVWEADMTTYTVRHYKQNVDLTGWEADYETETIDAQIGQNVTAAAKNYEGFTCSNTASGIVLAGGNLVLSLYYTRDSHTISFNTSGGSSVNAITAAYGATVKAPADPTRNGYKFLGWYYGASEYTFTTMPAEDITLVAQWEQEFYNVTLYNGTETYKAYTNKAYGDVITLDTPEAPANYKFDGWYTDADFNNKYTSDTYTVTASQNFYAKFVIDGYEIGLYVNNELKGTVNVLAGSALTQADVDEIYTVPAGYTMSAWKLNDVDIALPYTPTSSINLYATVTVKRVNFYFFINDGEGDEFIYYDGTNGQDFDPTYTVTANYGNAFKAPEISEVEGYEFDGWYTDRELTKAYDIPATMPEDGLYLYGTYRSLNATVTFDINGAEGTTPDAIDGIIGTNIDLPDASGFSKTNYEFAGWSTSKSADDIVTSYAIPEGGATLYAIWTAKMVKVFFNANGGEGTVEEIEIAAGSAVELPDGSELSKEFFTFAGWALTEDGEAIDTYTVGEEDATLYAVWTQNYVTIYFNANGAEGTVEEMTVAAGSAVELPDASELSKEFYTFAGWALTEDGDVLDSYTAGNADATLYAIWVENDIKIIATEEKNAIVDDVNEIIFGLEEGITAETFVDYITKTGNGHIRVKNFVTYFGTGTVVDLIRNETNEVIATYSIVLFGDLNGDGLVTSVDQTMLKKAANGSLELEGAAKIAADLNGDGIFGDSTDYALMKQVLKGKAEINQTWNIG